MRIGLEIGMKQNIIKIFCRKVRTVCRITYNALFNRPIGNIYMFHMVRPKEDYISALDVIRVSPENFEKFLIEHSKKEEFISIDEVPQRIKNYKKGNKPFAVVTFDDGYDDNFVYAYPILKRLQIPFVIYVSVNLVNDHHPIWNYPLIIERIIRKNDRLVLGNGETYICGTEEEKNSVFVRLKMLMFSWSYEQMHNEFQLTFGPYLTDDVFVVNTLTWEQIEQLSKDPLCTIGAHTMSHCRLMISDEKALSFEIGKSKEILEKKIGKPVLHMSYPYGEASVEAQYFARGLGYKTSPMAGGGPIRKNDTNISMYALKRISISE